MLEVRDVTKTYGARKVLDAISFSIGDAGILGFLGPNGAGKSTTMNIIAGYTSSTEGTVTINGYEVLEDPIGYKRNIGYLPEHPPLYPDMPVGDYLSFVFDLKKPAIPKKPHLAEIAETVGIGDVWKRIIRNLSKGYQQRVGLAQAMLGNPKLLILDEPTVGLDPKQLLDVRNLIRDLGKRCAVIFSSHILQEIQAVCERIIVINRGILVANDTQDNLARHISGDHRLELCADGPADRIRAALSALPGVKRADRIDSTEGAAFLLESERGRDIRRDLFRVMAENNWPILTLKGKGMSLEDVFLRLTAGDYSALSILTQNAQGGEAL
ncbi:MAG: ABC transporter ATP-binding protein [Treponema sp.]|jgi:ABC-2 type transport system ATP-binding protein|nr:ABC transporter ATP-binding protein [Treponema sp.]